MTYYQSKPTSAFLTYLYSEVVKAQTKLNYHSSDAELREFFQLRLTWRQAHANYYDFAYGFVNYDKLEVE